MTVRSKAYLKTRFESGDKPTAQDFVDLIDSLLSADLEDFPEALPPVDASALVNLPIPDPLPAVSGEFLTNLNRSDWVAISAVPSYATATSFVVSGDFTGPQYFVVGRRVRIHLNPTGFYFGSVQSATYDGGSNTTTVVVDETIPTSALAEVDVNLIVDSDVVITSIQPGSVPALAVYRKNAAGTNVEGWTIPTGSQAAPSLVELATDAETQALADATRGVTPAGLAAAAVAAPTPARLVRRDAAGRAQVAAPAVAADIATKGYVDGLFWESAEQVIVSSSTITVEHGLGAVPRVATACIRCKTAEHGYAVGEEVELGSVQSFGDAANKHDNAVVVAKDATNVYLVVGHDETPLIYNKTNQQRTTITNANWRLVARAIR